MGKRSLGEIGVERGALRRLPCLCPSNSDGPRSFYAGPCSGAACSWWSAARGACSAEGDGAETFARWISGRPSSVGGAVLPPCPAADRCAWHLAARGRGAPACYVRRLGLVCRHQAEPLLASGVPRAQVDAVAIWDTFGMADPDDPCWGG